MENLVHLWHHMRLPDVWRDSLFVTVYLLRLYLANLFVKFWYWWWLCQHSFSSYIATQHTVQVFCRCVTNNDTIYRYFWEFYWLFFNL